MSEREEPEVEAPPASGRAVTIWKFGTAMASKMAGGMAGVVTTSMTANPFLGVAVGTTLALSLEKVGTHLVETRLGPRQRIRVGRAIAVAAVRMEERLGAGEKVRDDAFVQPDGEGRSAADEAIESALLAAMNSAEEKKVDFLGALMTSIALDSSISASDAQLMIEIAESLRYRALVVLKIVYEGSANGWPARGGEDVAGPPANLYPLMAQIYDMTRRGLVEMKDAPHDTNLYAVLGPDEIDPSKLYPSPLGEALCKHMELRRLPQSDPIYAATIANLSELSGCGRGPMRVEARIDGGEF